MNERPHLLKPKRQSLGLSPTRQRAADDILGELTPSTAVEVLLSPAGAIKGCMDLASPAEKEFAMRTAMASQRICEWLQELRDWNWPAEMGPAGFEEDQGAAQRRLFVGGKASEHSNRDDYMGCLRIEEVAKYAWRVEKIQRDMDELGVDEIKAHVLAHHIMPLSRPGTPLSDTSRRSAIGYNKMEDLSVIVTAMIVQTLPNLARLSRLLQIWAMRLTVLQHLTPFLHAIDEAERTLQAGWDAVNQLCKQLAELDHNDYDTPIPKFSLNAESFAIMKKYVTRKVSKPGRTVDFMLDCLEGMDDTLPDSWLDRMEVVEHSYSEWVAVGERKVREATWAKALRHRGEKRLSDSSVSAVTADEYKDEPSTLEGLGEAPPQFEISTPDISREEMPRFPAPTVLPEEPSTPDEVKAKAPARWSSGDDDVFEGPMSPVKEEEEEGEPDLPPLRDSDRLDSDDLVNETVLHGASSRIDDDLFSEPPEISGSPGILKAPIRMQKFPQDSPPSSPPLPGDSTRADSSMLLDSPTVASVADFDDSVFTRTPGDSFTEDFDDSYSVPEISSPGPKLRRESVGEQHLRQQISQIIEGIPAKIKFGSESSSINLNPPDLQLPRLNKKPSKDRFRRSTSSVSSRTATPSFTLTPAKNPRSRSSRGQQEIKVYHLSRSTGEAPIKLFIRCVGENGERVMVRVGGGWADLSEYLKEYASHHGRRSGRAEDTTVEVRDLPQPGIARATNREGSKEPGSSPPSRPGSAAATEQAPFTPINVRKKRRSAGATNMEIPKLRPKTPAAAVRSTEDAPASEDSTRSRSSSRLSWVEDDSSFLGLAGPSGRRVEMSDESKAWVESVKEKVRLASGERKVSGPANPEKKFGELGRVGGTKRLFRKAGAPEPKR